MTFPIYIYIYVQSHKSHVPNHQPATHIVLVFMEIIQFQYATFPHSTSWVEICVVSAKGSLTEAFINSKLSLTNYHLVIQHSHGKSHINEGFNGNILYKWAILHGYVKQPEGRIDKYEAFKVIQDSSNYRIDEYPDYIPMKRLTGVGSKNYMRNPQNPLQCEAPVR